jgi:hypothetical protein
MGTYTNVLYFFGKDALRKVGTNFVHFFPTITKGHKSFVKTLLKEKRREEKTNKKEKRRGKKNKKK